MKRVLQILLFIVGLPLMTLSVVASPSVDLMSDIEVSEYAVHMSRVLEQIQYRQLCAMNDTYCVRAEFARQGIAYDDKVAVQKRLVLMVGSIR